MPDVKATIEQRAAIGLRGGSLLVSAGAGSGKTWVLTQRLMAYIDPGHNGGDAADITDFLVITFTRAAAGELKTRIAEAISKAVAEESAKPEPDVKRLNHLRRQTALAAKAHLSTIHSFCADMIRELGTAAGIRTDFRIIDDERAEAIKTTALNRVLEQRYSAPGNWPGFTDLSDKLCRGRDDRLLADLIRSTYEKLQSQAYPEVWIETQKQAMEKDYQDLAQSPWGRELISETRAKASFWKRKMDLAVQELLDENGKTMEKYMESFSSAAASLDLLCRAMDFENGGSWEKCREASKIEFVKLKTLRNPDDPDLQKRMKKTWDNCKKACVKIREVFAAEQCKILSDIRMTVPALEALMDTALDFAEEFTREKQRNALMDYSDLEHAAARLLTDERGNQTETGRTVAGRFTEIMVDEYQDVSRVQDAIFSAVSNNGSNLFLVGDIKQSIYRFRLAAPEIFKNRYESFADWQDLEGNWPKRIALRDNFRSGRKIIDAINSIFSRCMSLNLGDIDYSSPDQQLKAPEEKAFDGERPELVILQPPPAEEVPEELSKAVDYEAEWVAKEISKLLDSGILIGRGEETERRIEQSDIAILLRSYRSAEPVFRRELEKHGISVRSDSETDYMSEPETAFIVNMLSITDNPHKDVPLLAVLRSPAFNFTADELAAIRASNKDSDIFDALKQAALTDENCRNFLDILKGLRDIAPGMPVSELVWKIICDNDLLAVASAMKDGARRRDRLLSFIESTAEFEESDYIGLHAFIGWLERRAKREPSTEAGSGVTVMTIHKSKGLEFPVVFLCGTGKRFNTEDTKGRVLLDPDLGLGSELVDPDRKIRCRTAARSAVAGKITRENLSEEMRLLYVALTRAKEKLIITGTVKDADEFINNIRGDVSESVPEPELLASYDSHLKWLTAASIAEGGSTFDRKVVHLEAHNADAGEDSSVDIPEPDAGEVTRLEMILRENLSMKYPYQQDTELPSKITATELKGMDTADDEAQQLLPQYDDLTAAFPLPDFGRSDTPLSAAEKGIATHLLLQHIDLSKTTDTGSVIEEIGRLKNEGFITDRQAEAIKPDTVLRLFGSDIGRRMIKAGMAGRLRREFRFSILADASRFFDTGSEEKILLQGVIDCFFEENGGLVIVDYKTDRVFEEEEISERAEYYRGQLAAYAHALSRICGKKVKECILFFLAAGKEVKLAAEM